MDLVEHDERGPGEMMREQIGRGGHLLVGDDDPVDLVAPRTVGVAPARVEMEPDAVGRIRPLRPQRRRGADDDRLPQPRASHRLAGRERLARSRCGDEQEVGGCVALVRGEKAACHARGATLTPPARPSRGCSAGTAPGRSPARSRRPTARRARDRHAIRAATARRRPRIDPGRRGKDRPGHGRRSDGRPSRRSLAAGGAGTRSVRDHAERGAEPLIGGDGTRIEREQRFTMRGRLQRDHPVVARAAEIACAGQGGEHGTCARSRATAAAPR